MIYLFCFSFEVCAQGREYINSYFKEYFSNVLGLNYMSLQGWKKNIFIPSSGLLLQNISK